jgi:hypothetical protein
MQGLASNVDQLCKELGCNTQQQQSGAPCPPGNGGSSTLLTDIRQLVLGMQARDQNFSSLQIAVHGLLDVLSASDAQKGAGMWLFKGSRESNVCLMFFLCRFASDCWVD